MVRPFRKRSPFGAADDTRSAEAEEGVLSGLIGQPLRWRVALSKPPRRQLQYYFYEVRLIPRIRELQNVDTRVFTPAGSTIGASIDYRTPHKRRRDNDANICIWAWRTGKRRDARKGRPFYLDMTFGAAGSLGETYLGLDFGTSNPSLSFVRGDDIKVFEDRARDKNWLSLNELVTMLPYPIALPGNSVAEVDSTRLENYGREILEMI